MSADGWDPYWKSRDVTMDVVPDDRHHGVGPWPPPPGETAGNTCGCEW